MDIAGAADAPEVRVDRATGQIAFWFGQVSVQDSAICSERKPCKKIDGLGLEGVPTCS